MAQTAKIGAGTCPAPGGCDSCPEPDYCTLLRLETGVTTQAQEKAARTAASSRTQNTMEDS